MNAALVRGQVPAPLKGCEKVFYQLPFVEWLRQKSDRSGVQNLPAYSFVGECADKNDWCQITGRDQFTQQLYSAETRHLDIGDKAARVVNVLGLQKLLGGAKCRSGISKGINQFGCGISKGRIIINDRYH